MMKKKTSLVILMAVLFIGFGISSAYAVSSWCHAGVVTKTGINPALANETSSKYAIWVNCTSAVGDWDGTRRFYLVPDLGDAGFAAALTAISTGQTVDVRVRSAENNSLMDILNLNRAK